MTKDYQNKYPMKDHLRQQALVRMIAAWMLFFFSVPLWTWVVASIRSGTPDGVFACMMIGMALDAGAWSLFSDALAINRKADEDDD